jgi:hypothetical protein
VRGISTDLACLGKIWAWLSLSATALRQPCLSAPGLRENCSRFLPADIVTAFVLTFLASYPRGARQHSEAFNINRARSSSLASPLGALSRLGLCCRECAPQS